MLKLSNFLVGMILLIGCVNSKKETGVLVFESHIQQYFDIFINDNKKINPESNVIIIKCGTTCANDFTLNIISELQKNIDYSFFDVQDSMYFGNYKKFRVFIIDHNRKLLKSEYNNAMSLMNSYSDEIIPISYNGAFWNLKISDGKMVDFSCQYCEPNGEIIEQLKSIPIPASWGSQLNE